MSNQTSSRLLERLPQLCHIEYLGAQPIEKCRELAATNTGIKGDPFYTYSAIYHDTLKAQTPTTAYLYLYTPETK